MKVILLHSISKNEAKVIDFLVRNFREKNSINETGRKLGLSPRGIYKVLKKLENNNIIIPEKIGNAIYYKYNFNEEKSRRIAEFVLLNNSLNSYAQIQADDLKKLEGKALSCILFGSVIKKGKEAKDIDILLVIEKKNFDKIQKILDEIKDLKPKKIHDVVQTREDLVKNIKKNNEAILDIIKNGKLLWGADIIIEAVKNGTTKIRDF